MAYAIRGQRYQADKRQRIMAFVARQPTKGILSGSSKTHLTADAIDSLYT